MGLIGTLRGLVGGILLPMLSAVVASTVTVFAALASSFGRAFAVVGEIAA